MGGGGWGGERDLCEIVCRIVCEKCSQPSTFETTFFKKGGKGTPK